MKDNITKMTILTIILLTILGVIGFSYAYFSTDINGEGKYITLDTAGLKLRYTDAATMSLNNAIPGDKIERTFAVENIGTKTVSYNIVWKDLINTKICTYINDKSMVSYYNIIFFPIAMPHQ